MGAKGQSVQPNLFGYAGSFEFSAKFWGLVVLAGVGAGVGGGFLMWLLRAAQHLAWSYHSGDFVSAVARDSAQRRVLVLLGAGVMVAVARRLWRRPTGGHGGDVAAAIWFHSGEMPFWRTLAKAVVSILAVAFGAALGRESAPKQTGGVISSMLAQWAGLPKSQRRLLVACGTGAGMAAVYNVPLGGALFALEVLLGQLSLPLVLPAMAASFVAVAVSWLFLSNRPTYSIPVYPVCWMALAGAAVLGLAAGLASVPYVKAIAWADERKPTGTPLLAAPIIVLTCLGAVAIAYPQLLGNGKDVVQAAFLDQLSFPLLAGLIVPRALATTGCLASGTPGGLFTPTLTIGALLGGLFGHIWNLAAPGEPAAAYAIFGAGAVLAAATKGPISSIVLLFELTPHLTGLAAPIIVAVAVATTVAKRLDARSVYSARIHIGKTAAGKIPEPRVISSAAPYAEILKLFVSHGVQTPPLYVVDESGALVGEITAQRAALAETFAAPLACACADDLALPAKTLSSALTPPEMRARLEAEGVEELPLVDPETNKLLGICRRGEEVK